MKHVLLAVTFSLTLFCSCTSMRYVSFEIKEPALITLGSDIKKIILVDNTFTSGNNNSAIQINSRDSLSTIIIDTVNYTLKSSFVKYMNEEKVFDTVEIYPYYPRPLYLYSEATSQSELPLTQDQIFEIYERTESDALLSFDLINIRLHPHDLQPYGAAAAYIEATMRVYSYDENIIGIPIKLKQSFNVNVDLYYTDSIIPRLKSIFAEESRWIADSFVDYFIPKWVLQERIYYTKAKAPSHDIFTLADKEKWSRTAILWENMYKKEKNLKKKAKWASNTALFHEYADDIETALKWINIAYDLFPSNAKSDLANQIREYRSILTRRVKDAPLLRKQLRIKDAANIQNNTHTK